MFSKEEYQQYINSPTWKQKRAAALERAQHRCQVCGFSKWSRKLEVHHLTYERFQRERPEDLMVVCVQCHEEEDKRRAERGKQKGAQALRNARLNGWAIKVYGEHWKERSDTDSIREQYQEWAESKADE